MSVRSVALRVFSFALCLWFATCVLAADPATIAPGQMQKAEGTYRELFGAGHDKAIKATKPSDKSEFAKKLWDSAQKATGDPALQEVLRRNALQFAQTDPLGTSIALEIHRAYLAFPSRKAGALDKIAAIQERTLLTMPIADRSKTAGEIIKTYREAVAEYERLSNPAAAIAALGKARTLGKKYSPLAKDLFTSLDADEKRLQLATTEFADIDRLKAALDKNPADVKSRAALGCRYLRMNRPADAMAHFQATNDPDWKAFATAIEQKPISPTDIGIKAINLLTSLPTDDKKSRFAILDFARSTMESVRSRSLPAWFALLPTYTVVLDRISGLEPPGHTARLATAAFLAYYDLAEYQAEKATPAEALNAVSKARSALKSLKPGDIKDFTSDLDQLEKALKSRLTLASDVMKLQLDAKSLDASGQLALGIGLLRMGRPFEAMKHLELCGVKSWQNIGKYAALGEKASPLEFGNALREIAVECKGDEKIDVLGLARQKYELYLSTAGASADRTRVELLINELPRSSVLGNVQKPILLLTPEYIKLLAEKGYGPSIKKTALDGSIATVETEYANGPEMGWKYKIAEKPTLVNEIRYVGFAWKTDNFNSLFLVFHANNYRGYLAGKSTGDTKLMSISTEAPKAWTVVVRDLYKDFGAMELTGMGIGSVDKGSSQIAAIYVGSSLAQVRRAVLRVQPE